MTPRRDGVRTVIQITGTVDGSAPDRYEVQIGQGGEPAAWGTVLTEKGERVDDGVLAAVPLSEITARGQWTIRVLANDPAGKTRESRGVLNVW